MILNTWRGRVAAACVLGALSGTAVSVGLDQPNLVDRIRVDSEARQATLVLVADAALDQTDATRALERKVAFYLQYVEGGRLYKDRTGISRGTPVIISFNLLVAPSPPVREYLEGMKQALEKRGYQIRFNVSDPATKKLQPL